MADALTPRDPRKLGRWKITSRLGFGGMGVVYLGSDGHLDAAVKVIRPGLLDDHKMVDRFVREVEVLQAVRDVHISQFLDASLTSEPAWLAVEYISGPTVKQHVDSDGPLAPEKWWSLAAGIAQALAVLEVHRVTHRDIKPSNVILSGPGGSRPVLIDFGIAHPEDATSLTATGLVTGSPSWLSPEQANMMETGSPSDIFSLGSLLAYAGTGKPPFGEGVAVAVLMRITNSEPDLVGLGPDQRALVEAMLAKDPAARPSAREVLARAREGARSVAGVAGDGTLPGFPASTVVLQRDGGQVASVPPVAAPQPSDTTSPELAPVGPPAVAAVPPPITAPPPQVVVTPRPTPSVPGSQPAANPSPQVAAAPAPKARRPILPWLVAVVAVLVAVGAVWFMGGSGDPGAGGDPSESASASPSKSSASPSPTSNGDAPPAPSSDQLKSGDWLLSSYRLGNDANSMWVEGTIANRGTSAASANLVVWIYANGTALGSVSTTVNDVPAGGSTSVRLDGDAKWAPGTKVVLLEADPL